MPARDNHTRRRGHRASGAVLLAAAWLVGLAALLAVLHVEGRADAERRAQVLVEQLSTKVGELPAAAFSTSVGQNATVAEARARLAETGRGVNVLLAQIDQLDTGGDPGLGAAVLRQRNLMNRMVTLTRTGEADRLFAAAQRPGGAQAQIRDELELASRRHSQKADSARSLSAFGSAAAILVTLFAFSITLLRVRRAQGHAEALAAENARLYERSRHESQTDSLTGLANRRRLFRDMDKESGEASPQMLGLLDLDGFKDFNDTFGHPAGDALLRRLGERLAEDVGGTAAAYRMGGDEFCVIANNSQADAVMARAQRALSEVADDFEIRCSLGTARIPAEAPDLEQALQLADQRLYIDKQANRRVFIRGDRRVR